MFINQRLELTMKVLYIIAIATAVFLMSGTANAGRGYGRDLAPEHRIGNLYCYSGWEGDTDISAHAVFTDRPLRAEVCRGEADPCQSVRRGTKVIDIDIEHFKDDKRRGWMVQYSDRSFYKAHKREALQCMGKINPAAAKDFPLTRIRQEVFQPNVRRY